MSPYSCDFLWCHCIFNYNDYYNSLTYKRLVFDSELSTCFQLRWNNSTKEWNQPRATFILFKPLLISRPRLCPKHLKQSRCIILNAVIMFEPLSVVVATNFLTLSFQLSNTYVSWSEYSISNILICVIVVQCCCIRQ